MRRILFAGLGLLCAAGAWAQGCGDNGAAVQVLGSGRAELAGGRAASGALVWSQGRPRALVDAGPGVALRLAQAGASPAALDVVLLSRLDIEYSADLAAIAEGAWLRERNRILPVFGPRGNSLMPSTVSFVRTLFDPVRGAWRHRGDLLTPLGRGTYKLRPFDVMHKPGQAGPVFHGEQFSVTALPSIEDGIPVLAWRIELDGKSVVFAGELRGAGVEQLARGADLMIVHEPAAAQGNGAEPRALAAIAGLAQRAGVRGLVFSHRRQPPPEDSPLAAIRQAFDGAVSFAADLGCYSL